MKIFTTLQGFRAIEILLLPKLTQSEIENFLFFILRSNLATPVTFRVPISLPDPCVLLIFILLLNRDKK